MGVVGLLGRRVHWETIKKTAAQVLPEINEIRRSEVLRLASAIGAAALAVATVTPPAHAGVTWTTHPGLGTPQLGDLLIDFDGPLPGSVSLSFVGDGGIYKGSSTRWAAPYGDTTQYLSSGIGSAILTFDTFQRSVQLDWSSVDLYNTLQLFDGSSLVGALTGGQVHAGANGYRGPGGTFNIRVAVSADQNWDRLVASSTHYAFELDNVAVSGPPNLTVGGPPLDIAEPASLTLLGFGLLGMAVVTRKQMGFDVRRQTSLC